ncbi:Ubiquitin carboxyl-terminal hydrolase MINDY-2 [Mactra antiquata]
MAESVDNNQESHTLRKNVDEDISAPVPNEISDNQSSPPTAVDESTSSDHIVTNEENTTVNKPDGIKSSDSNEDDQDANMVRDSMEEKSEQVTTKSNDEIDLDNTEQVDNNEKSKDEKSVDLNSVPPAAPVDTDNNEASGGSEGAGSSCGSKVLDNGESIHQIKWVYFKKKHVPIITQNENGPCPLLALINVLLLQNRVKLTPQAEIVSASQLMAHLGDCVLQNVPGEDGVSTPSRLNFEQNMGDAMAVMYKLQTGLDVNVRFTGVRDFEYTSECIIFDLLQISLYHGWLVDPQNSAEVEAVGKCSYNQLVEKIIVQKTSDEPNLVSQALVAEQFLESSASQLTYHGLSELCTQLKEDELAVLFRNNHFTTLYRYKVSSNKHSFNT